MLRSSLFIVRVWRQRCGGAARGFRASVRAVDDERERIFARPADLVAFLARKSPDGLQHDPSGRRTGRK
jgi:hypothetical protein